MKQFITAAAVAGLGAGLAVGAVLRSHTIVCCVVLYATHYIVYMLGRDEGINT